MDAVIAELSKVGTADGFTIRDLSARFVHVTTIGWLWTVAKWTLLGLAVVVVAVLVFQFCGGVGMVKRRRRKNRSNREELDLEANLPSKAPPILRLAKTAPMAEMQPLDPNPTQPIPFSVPFMAEDTQRALLHQVAAAQQASRALSYYNSERALTSLPY